jgi:hypothetical protein
MLLYHEGTKDTKGTKPAPVPRTRTLLWGVRCGFVSFVSFVPSW